MTIKKGYHYTALCDIPECELAYVVGTSKHNWEAKRQAKQKLIKEGWEPEASATWVCPGCAKKRKEELDEVEL